MKRVMFLLSLFILATSMAKEKQKKSKEENECIVVIGDGKFMEFSTIDKALYHAENMKAQCKCDVYVLKTDREWLKNCLWTAVNHVRYPANFNHRLFIQDVREYLGRGQEVEVCKSLKSLEEILPLLKSLQMVNIAQEVEKYLRKWETR